jgi:hypothetical protein
MNEGNRIKKDEISLPDAITDLLKSFHHRGIFTERDPKVFGIASLWQPIHRRGRRSPKYVGL